MRALAQLVLWVAIVLFVGIGLSGIFFGPWELIHLVPSDLAEVSLERATVFNQLRFLKAMELAMGLVLFSLRREALDDADKNRAVLAVLWLTPLARVASLFLDGAPHPMFSALLAVELSGALVMSVYAAMRFSRSRAIVRA